MRNRDNRRIGGPNPTSGSDQVFDNPVFGPDEWLTTEEAAAFLKIPAASLRNMASAGRVPFYKLGSKNRYRKSELANLLFENRRGGI